MTWCNAETCQKNNMEKIIMLSYRYYKFNELNRLLGNDYKPLIGSIHGRMFSFTTNFDRIPRAIHFLRTSIPPDFLTDCFPKNIFSRLEGCFYPRPCMTRKRTSHGPNQYNPLQVCQLLLMTGISKINTNIQ